MFNALLAIFQPHDGAHLLQSSELCYRINVTNYK